MVCGMSWLADYIISAILVCTEYTNTPLENTLYKIILEKYVMVIKKYLRIPNTVAMSIRH